MRVFDVTITLQVVDMKDRLSTDTLAADLSKHVQRAIGYMTGENEGAAASTPDVSVAQLVAQAPAPVPTTQPGDFQPQQAA